MTEKKVAFITGGARGIGWATAQEFLREGWCVTIGDVDTAEAERCVGTAPARVLALGLDVAERPSVERAIAAALDHWGGLDVLVNNAGIQRHGPLESLPFESWKTVLGVNLDGAFHCLQVAARHMLEKGSGAIVNVASVAATRGAAGRAPYAASKAAIISLTRTAAVEWAARGIRVNAVAPGYVETDLVTTFVAAGRLDLSPIVARTPAGRLAAPEEIAKAIRFLASDEASYINGQVLFVDGGFEADYGVPFSPPKAAPQALEGG
jgi:3-oxoacyl-[acyl-carrier protein] reductase